MQKISVVGAGTMGNGITHVFAMKGFDVNLIDVSQQQIEKAVATISKNLDRQVSKNVITEEEKKNILTKISTFNSIKEGVKDADLIIEAATENLELKLKIFSRCDASAKDPAYLASNTSS